MKIVEWYEIVTDWDVKLHNNRIADFISKLSCSFVFSLILPFVILSELWSPVESYWIKRKDSLSENMEKGEKE